MASGIRELFESMEYGPAPELAQPALDWIAKNGGEFGHFIGGAWVKGTGGWIEVEQPSTGNTIAKIAKGTKTEVDSAVVAAKKGQTAWWKLGGHGRAKVLYALARQLQKHSRLFAVLESIDNGKPIRETRDLDIPLAARHFYHHAGWAQLMDEELPGAEPVGVVGQIIPWNFPLLMLSWKIAPALAMGNAVILKPAEFTSLTALLFAEICEAAGVPPGVVNILTGDGETGKLIVEHPDIQKIAFTGSTEVGRIIRQATAGTGKKISLELGGKSPFIVFEDADLDSAVEGVVDAIWFNQGQVCCAGSRLLVQESVADRFLTKLRRRMDTLRVGDPLDKAIDVGAIVAKVQLDRIQELVQTGVDEGATKYCCPSPLPESGWFCPPTLLTNVSPASTVAQVEIFGPVLVGMTFKTPAEAVAIANNTVYGLAASVWSENLNLAHDIATKVKAGTVWINCTNQFDGASGFGGYRESGYGREGGKEGLWEYVRLNPKVENPAQTKATGEIAAGVDRTYKLYIGGKHARPDGGYSYEVKSPSGKRLAELALGNRKDIRNAVESASNAAASWAKLTPHARAQILYFLGENLSARENDFAKLLSANTGFDGAKEVSSVIETIFAAAAYADKWDGSVHQTGFAGMVYTANEPLGVLGVICPETPALSGFIKPLVFGMAAGNAVVAVPSHEFGLAAAEFVQILETSDIPAGVANVITGIHEELAKTLAQHEAVDSLWCFEPVLAELVERESVSNLKQTWCPHPEPGWFGCGSRIIDREFLRRATQVKNVWVPYGE